MQPAIGSTGRADKHRAGRVELLFGEWRAGKTLYPCSAVAGMQEGKMVKVLSMPK